MKKRLLLCAAGLLSLTFILLAGGAAKSSGQGDFAEFRKGKLMLPEITRPVRLSAPGDGIVLRTGKEEAGDGARDLYFGAGGRRYVLTIPSPLPEYRLKKELTRDLNRDGLPEKYSLRDGELTVVFDRGKIWRTPGQWWVDDFFTGDADNDSREDLCLLVWKTGSFGSRHPFWVTGEDRSIKSHLFIFDRAGDSFKAVWQSSSLDCPNCGSVLYDIDGDGKNELVVSEGEYAAAGKRRVTAWRWNGWGFSIIPVDGESGAGSDG